mgnify:CR=1 FL=1
MVLEVGWRMCFWICVGRRHCLLLRAAWRRAGTPIESDAEYKSALDVLHEEGFTDPVRENYTR